MITNYFVQHGLAEPKEIDATRPLSKEGVEQVRKMATQLHQHGVLIENIYHSGKLRAAQTAQIFAEVLQVKLVNEFKGMNPNDDPHNIISHLKQDNVMFVGHLPNIQKVVSEILSNGKNDDMLKFSNAAVACISQEQGNAFLKWFIKPELE